MIDPLDLTETEKTALRRIGMWKLKRKRGGYGLHGESWLVSLATVQKLRAKGLISVMPGARFPVLLTGEGRNTLGVMDERARSKADG